MKNFRFILILSFTLILSLSNIVPKTYAGTWSDSVSWYTSEGSYSPSFGNTSMYQYVDSDGWFKVSPKVRFNFTSSQMNAVHNYYNNNRYYYTMDITATPRDNKSVDAIDYYYTDLPDPKFDIDNDGVFNNGYDEETEVVSTSPLEMVAYQDYRFEAYFKVYDVIATDPVKFHFTSAVSSYNWIPDRLVGEYNTKYYDEHLTRNYPFIN
ncbi:hypothetical protein VQL36_04925 [Chengkuizengella sp. SCS-71B]|uniref:hypothetical protein n=1 Tax=Chengkuizengella sp. SCS-71B TaxID=3115290 RepID=UPI0032C22E41